MSIGITQVADSNLEKYAPQIAQLLRGDITGNDRAINNDPLVVWVIANKEKVLPLEFSYNEIHDLFKYQKAHEDQYDELLDFIQENNLHKY